MHIPAGKVRTCLSLGTLALAIATVLHGEKAAAQDAVAEDAVAAESGAAFGVTDEILVTGDPLRIIPNEDSASSFGFNKPLLETPRSVSFVSEEQITLLGISTADDLARVVPGTFTNRRWGLQGGIDVRNTPADMYFRGMKRLNMQGHARTSLAGMDAIEVVKGPPSPIFGMGRIGGYTNLQPKLGRATEGGYLPAPTGLRATDLRHLGPHRNIVRRRRPDRLRRGGGRCGGRLLRLRPARRLADAGSSRCMPSRRSCRRPRASTMRSAISASSSARSTRTRTRPARS